MKFYKEFQNEINQWEKKRVWSDEIGYVRAYPLKNGYITERLTEQRVSEWNAHTPVFISAQTGAGKTTLIFDILLPILKERGKRIVILCCRSVLAEQIKRIAAKHEMPDYPEDLIEAYVKCRNSFGSVDVYTYQELALRFQSEDFTRKFRYYGAVVCDECHYFVQDAVFNEFSGRVFRFIQKHATRAIRLYLTATPEPVVDMIADYEFNHKNRLLNHVFSRGSELEPQFLFYSFERDYSYINPYFFQDWGSIVEEIAKHSSNEKWLIFVSKKEVGKMLEEVLGQERALYVDAKLKNDERKEEIKDMLIKNQFSQQILVVTKFLDVGVDLWDGQLKNVVLSTLDKTDFIQSLGRKRLKKGETVNVFIRIPDMNEISKRKQVASLRLKQIFESIQAIKEKGSLTSQLEFPIYVETCGNQEWKVQHNHMAILAYEQQKETLDEFKECAENNWRENIAKKYLSWLNAGGKYEKERWLDCEGSEGNRDVENFILSWTNRDLSAEEFDRFRQEITGFIKCNYSGTVENRSDRAMGTKKIREFFTKMNVFYRIENTEKGIHRIVRG